MAFYTDTLHWLLEPDSPGVRYLALRDLTGLPPGDPELIAARRAAHSRGPISSILAEMAPEGFWVEPGPGYNPKYRSLVWSLIMLAQLGASAAMDERIGRACAYLLDHSITENGQFTVGGAPSTTADCLQGNMCDALTDLGFDDPRLDKAFDWMARSVTGEGVAPNTDRQASLRYYAGKCGPTFACGANNKLPCAWGGVKVMLAFAKLPSQRRTPLIQRAIAHGVDFLFSCDPADAEYPTGWSNKPSGNWWKFGFPVFYVTDLLQNVEALVELGYGDDPRLARSLDLIRGKQDDRGRWPLEYDYAGKTWVDFGKKKQPNKWVTLRALRALSRAEKGSTRPFSAQR
ncbi:MAG: nitrogen fixation protein NifH [Chloroflexi bacterium]|nr:nitrogen fixation protein NifH [Chloroflexota bacterium]